MQISRRAFLRSIGLTAFLTSALWIALAAWWYHRYISSVPTRPLMKSLVVAPTSGAVQDPSPASTGVADHLLIPVTGVREVDLVDTFTQSRSEDRQHDAIDIVAPVGTPVVAAAAGKVERLFLSRQGGKTIYVRTDGGRTIHYYAHLDRYAADLHEGQWLRAGQQLGVVGFSGNADPSAPHLHFAVMVTEPARKWYEPATAINPYPLLSQSRAEGRKVKSQAAP